MKINFIILSILLTSAMVISEPSDSTNLIDTAVAVDSIEKNIVDTVVEKVIDSFYTLDSDSDIATIDTYSFQESKTSDITITEVDEDIIPNNPHLAKSYAKKIVAIGKKYLIRVLILLVLIIIISIIWYQLSRYFDKEKFLTSTRLSLMDKEVQLACRYMEKHYFDPGLNIDSICKELVTGASFLESVFEKELGMCVDDFLMQVRINRARILLDKYIDMDISDLASSVGYVDIELFAGDFKKSTGMQIEKYIKTISN